MGGLNRSGVDPPLTSSRTCLMTFIANSVPRLCVSLGQCNAILVPSLRPKWGKIWAASTGFWALSPLWTEFGAQRLMVSHFGVRRDTGMLAVAGPPGHIPVCRVLRVMGGAGRTEVTLMGHCHWPPSWAIATGPGLFRSLGFRNPSGYWLVWRSTYNHTRGGKGGVRAPA